MAQSGLVKLNDELHEIDGKPIKDLLPDKVRLLTPRRRPTRRPMTRLLAISQVTELVQGSAGSPIVLTVRTPHSN